MRVRLIEDLDFGGEAGITPADTVLEVAGEHGAECWRCVLDGQPVVVPRTSCVLAGGPRATPEEAKQRLVTAAVVANQTALNDFARTRGYEDIWSAISYHDSVVPRFAAEGAFCKFTRDMRWALCWTILAREEAAMAAGDRTELPTLQEIAAELDAAYPLVWPDTAPPAAPPPEQPE